MKECHGWDKYKEEGLAELERIKSFMSLPKDEELIDFVERYIELYKDKKICKKEDLSAVTFYLDLVEEKVREEVSKFLEEEVAESKDKDALRFLDEKYMDMLTKKIINRIKTDTKRKATKKPKTKIDMKMDEIEKVAKKTAQDKASRVVKKLREFLRNFYESDKGKESEYRIDFVSDERDFSLKIGKGDISSETRKEMTGPAIAAPQIGLTVTKLYGLSRVKEVLLDFLKIYAEAWAMPKSLVARSTASKTFNWDTIAIFLLSAMLTVLIAHYYFSSFRFYIETASIHPVFIGFLINLLEKIEKPFDNILSFNLLFFIFRFTIITTIIPWLIYNKVFKGKVSIYEMMNFQFYFIMSWSPIFAWIGFAAVKLTFLNADTTLLGLFTTILGLWVLYTYYKCLYQLSGFTWKKGILPYTIYIPLHFWFIRTL